MSAARKPGVFNILINQLLTHLNINLLAFTQIFDFFLVPAFALVLSTGGRFFLYPVSDERTKSVLRSIWIPVIELNFSELRLRKMPFVPSLITARYRYNLNWCGWKFISYILFFHLRSVICSLFDRAPVLSSESEKWGIYSEHAMICFTFVIQQGFEREK